jgi:hypothetical protein
MQRKLDRLDMNNTHHNNNTIDLNDTPINDLDFECPSFPPLSSIIVKKYTEPKKNRFRKTCFGYAE